jgi:hypothetical protein
MEQLTSPPFAVRDLPGSDKKLFPPFPKEFLIVSSLWYTQSSKRSFLFGTDFCYLNPLDQRYRFGHVCWLQEWIYTI